MISLKNVTKEFKVAKRSAGLAHAVKALFMRQHEVVRALDEVSFEVGEGEIVGYIGPNGAGKSTTIKIMCGVLHPTSGECVINGRVPQKQRVAHAREIGVVFGQRSQLWWDVPVQDSFELIKDIYAVDNDSFNRSLNELTELLVLGDLLKTPARSLSLGQRMRCELAASLLHSPKILFLDEPTIGLDAVSKIAVRQFIKDLNRKNAITVILTTHDMQDIEALASRIMLIGRGKILINGGLDELKRRTLANKIITAQYRGNAPNICNGLCVIEQREGRTVFSLNPQQLSASKAIAYLASQCELSDVTVADTSAEEMVATLYKELNI